MRLPYNASVYGEFLGLSADDLASLQVGGAI